MRQLTELSTQLPVESWLKNVRNLALTLDTLCQHSVQPPP